MIFLLIYSYDVWRAASVSSPILKNIFVSFDVRSAKRSTCSLWRTTMAERRFVEEAVHYALPTNFKRSALLHIYGTYDEEEDIFIVREEGEVYI